MKIIINKIRYRITQGGEAIKRFNGICWHKDICLG